MPISHSWPNGSTMRPRRQPCSSPTAAVSLAPACTARSTTASGSSTTSKVRPVAPPIACGLSRFIAGLAAATQNAASPNGELGDDVVALSDTVHHRRAERRLVERDGCRGAIDPQLGLEARHCGSRQDPITRIGRVSPTMPASAALPQTDPLRRPARGPVRGPATHGLPPARRRHVRRAASRRRHSSSDPIGRHPSDDLVPLPRERGVDPSLGTRLHQRMVDRPVFHQLDPPSPRGKLTMLDVPLEGDPELARGASYAWADDVWKAAQARRPIKSLRVLWRCSLIWFSQSRSGLASDSP